MTNITKEQVLANLEEVKKFIIEAEQEKKEEKVVGIAIKNRFTGEIITQESWEEALDKLSLKTQEENWTCDAGCGVDKEQIKSFITSLLSKQAEEISEAVWDLLKTPKYNEAQTYDLGVKHAIAAIKQVINKLV